MDRSLSPQETSSARCPPVNIPPPASPYECQAVHPESPASQCHGTLTCEVELKKLWRPYASEEVVDYARTHHCASELASDLLQPDYIVNKEGDASQASLVVRAGDVQHVARSPSKEETSSRAVTPTGQHLSDLFEYVTTSSKFRKSLEYVETYHLGSPIDIFRAQQVHLDQSTRCVVEPKSPVESEQMAKLLFLASKRQNRRVGLNVISCHVCGEDFNKLTYALVHWRRNHCKGTLHACHICFEEFYYLAHLHKHIKFHVKRSGRQFSRSRVRKVNASVACGTGSRQDGPVTQSSLHNPHTNYMAQSAESTLTGIGPVALPPSAVHDDLLEDVKANTYQRRSAEAEEGMSARSFMSRHNTKAGFTNKFMEVCVASDAERSTNDEDGSGRDVATKVTFIEAQSPVSETRGPRYRPLFHGKHNAPTSRPIGAQPISRGRYMCIVCGKWFKHRVKFAHHFKGHFRVYRSRKSKHLEKQLYHSKARGIHKGRWRPPEKGTRGIYHKTRTIIEAGPCFKVDQSKAGRQGPGSHDIAEPNQDKSKRHDCPLCLGHFSSDANLRRHLVDDHNAISYSGNKQPQSNESKCPPLSETKCFEKSEKLVELNPLFKCPHCRKKFKRELNMRRHVRKFHDDPGAVDKHVSDKLDHTVVPTQKIITEPKGDLDMESEKSIRGDGCIECPICSKSCTLNSADSHITACLKENAVSESSADESEPRRGCAARRRRRRARRKNTIEPSDTDSMDDADHPNDATTGKTPTPTPEDKRSLVNDDKHQCPMCMQFFTKNSVDSHVSNCLRENGSCNKRCSSSSGDVEGQNKCRDGNPATGRINPFQNKHECPVCKGFFTKNSLDSHVTECLGDSEASDHTASGKQRGSPPKNQRERHKTRTLLNRKRCQRDASSASSESGSRKRDESNDADTNYRRVECPICKRKITKNSAFMHITECQQRVRPNMADASEGSDSEDSDCNSRRRGKCKRRGAKTIQAKMACLTTRESSNDNAGYQGDDVCKALSKMNVKVSCHGDDDTPSDGTETAMESGSVTESYTEDTPVMEELDSEPERKGGAMWDKPGNQNADIPDDGDCCTSVTGVVTDYLDGQDQCKQPKCSENLPLKPSLYMKHTEQTPSDTGDLMCPLCNCGITMDSVRNHIVSCMQSKSSARSQGSISHGSNNNNVPGLLRSNSVTVEASRIPQNSHGIRCRPARSQSCDGAHGNPDKALRCPNCGLGLTEETVASHISKCVRKLCS